MRDSPPKKSLTIRESVERDPKLSDDLDVVVDVGTGIADGVLDELRSQKSDPGGPQE